MGNSVFGTMVVLEAEARRVYADAKAMPADKLAKMKIENRLVNSEFETCICGEPMALDLLSEGNGAWECRGLLVGTANRSEEHSPPVGYMV